MVGVVQACCWPKPECQTSCRLSVPFSSYWLWVEGLHIRNTYLISIYLHVYIDIYMHINTECAYVRIQSKSCIYIYIYIHKYHILSFRCIGKKRKESLPTSSNHDFSGDIVVFGGLYQVWPQINEKPSLSLDQIRKPKANFINRIFFVAAIGEQWPKYVWLVGCTLGDFFQIGKGAAYSA